MELVKYAELFHPFNLILTLPILKDLAVEESSSNSDKHCWNFEKWLLEQVCEKIPVLFSQWTSSKLVLVCDVCNTQGIQSDRNEGNKVTHPSLLLVNHHKEGDQ